ncbi:DUF126 domain-containing protein [Infirmifilum lucidum]|uniref:Phosphomevalonate dehydratase small subunit n=1 Tax=Infirmifilum lucidum TaxID=2776706 RepID=A0A7L9FIT8_9CREN|nr:DUF126 domain-containing protein [Infirmifilum lucidum]QOJ79551.1 DUF126 domain-containing protein [Infirmifilum lucidum]
MRIAGRPVSEGVARGQVLLSREPITFFGGVDPKTSEVVEPSHPLKGEKLAGKILVFPHSKGSTVGSYVLLRMAKRGVAPAGVVTVRPDEVVIIGCIISGIPSMTGIDEASLGKIRPGSLAEIRVGRSHAELVLYE